ncbi:MAG: hypothetical protein E6L08_11590 [Verrucomicrobia bacterium]|nr:MAG: hypothetical protein E6L08_11590 [Verrucomicrobiota bacterium]
MAVFADRFFPAFFHLPKLARSRLVVRFFAITILHIVDFFLAAPRRSVVGIEIEDLVISLKRKIVPAGLVVAVGFGEQRFYLFHFGDELRAHRFVEIAGLAQVRQQLPRRATVRIVTIAQNLVKDGFRPGIIGLRDARFR